MKKRRDNIELGAIQPILIYQNRLGIHQKDSLTDVIP